MLEHYHWAFLKGTSLSGWINIKFVRMCYAILNYTIKLLVHLPLWVTCSEHVPLLVLISSWGYQLTKTVQNGSPQPISEILHIEYRIVCCIEIYLIHIYHMSKCRQVQLKQIYWRILYVKCTFSHKWVIPKHHLCYLDELTFNGNLFSFIELLIIFCAVFISYLMVIYSKK